MCLSTFFWFLYCFALAAIDYFTAVVNFSSIPNFLAVTANIAVLSDTVVVM